MGFYSNEELQEFGFKHLGKNVLISKMTSIYNAKNISIGDNSRIDDFSIISAGSGCIDIGRYVHIACYVSLIGKNKIILRDYSGLSSRVAVYSSSDDYSGEYMTNPCVPNHLTNVIHGDVVIGKHVVVGANSVILPNVTLEDGCSVGALSLITKSFCGFNILGGVPAKVIGVRSENIIELERYIDKISY